MPTTDILGYLWTKRQALELADIPETVELAADLQRAGLECIRIETRRVLGRTAGSSVQLVRKTPEQWAVLVEAVIVNSAVEHASSMLHEGAEDQ